MARPTQEITKSARVNLAVLPELKHSLEKLATVDEVSVNSLVEKILTDYVQTRADEVDEFNDAMQKIRLRKKNRKE